MSSLALVDKIPSIIQSGLGQSGNLLPALGIAMLLQITFDKKFGVFFFVGFALAAFLKVTTIGAAFLGVCAAVIYYFFFNTKTTPATATTGVTATIADDDESEEL